MDFKLNEGTLTIFFEGEVNSVTAEDIGKETDSILGNNQFKNVVLDFKKVTYLSSAGLRIILRIKQKYNNVVIDNVSLEVYDVLSMTGFINIMEVRKALKEINLDGYEMIGEGYCSWVYRIDKDTIIKVLKFTTDVKDVERELNLAREAFILGIPTAISFDVVRVGDKLGVRFEMLDAASLRDLIRDNPDKLEEYITKYASLLRKINSTEANDPALPKCEKSWLDKLDFVKEYLDESSYKKARSLLETIPEKNTFVHGDCHIKNIMVQDDELFLIDMDTLSTGNPIFELAAVYCTYIAFEEDAPGNCLQFLGIPYEVASKLYYSALDQYMLGKCTDESLNKIKVVAYIHMLWWTKTFQKENQVRFDGNKARLIALLDNVKNLDLGF